MRASASAPLINHRSKCCFSLLYLLLSPEEVSVFQCRSSIGAYLNVLGTIWHTQQDGMKNASTSKTPVFESTASNFFLEYFCLLFGVHS